jgi:hypothetical protein
MAYLKPSLLSKFNIKSFLLYFCTAYTFLDITGAVVASLNHTGGGVVHDSIPVVSANTNSTVNLVITVKPVAK